MEPPVFRPGDRDRPAFPLSKDQAEQRERRQRAKERPAIASREAGHELQAHRQRQRHLVGVEEAVQRVCEAYLLNLHSDAFVPRRRPMIRPSGAHAA